MNQHKLRDVIWNLPLNKQIALDREPLRSIVFRSETIEGRKQYIWSCDCAPSYGMYKFPMRSRNYVKFFKTLKGAKRNFINKHLKIEPKNGVEKAVCRIKKC